MESIFNLDDFLNRKSRGVQKPFGMWSEYDTPRSENYFGLYGQVTKRARWMPWQSEAMKDVVICEKVRGVDKQTLIRTCPNGETHSTCRVSHSEYIAVWRRTRGTETSKYPEEKKSTEIP